MTRSPFLLSMIGVCLLAGGCTISGGADVAQEAATPIQSATLPPLPPIDVSADASTHMPAADGTEISEKFSQSETESLSVTELASGTGDGDSRQAYFDQSVDKAVISAQSASLRPFVGRWVLDNPRQRSNVEKIGAFLGFDDQCEITLEEARASNGYKASGTSACPTSLFLLDSWVPFENQLVLRDHMGDEIVKLKSRGSDVWIGVNKAGETLVLNKS